MLEHLLSIAEEMFGKQHREFDVVFTEDIQQQLLPVDLRQLAEVAITPKDVECVVDQATLSARSQVGLQFREVGPAFMDDDYLAVDDSFAGNRQRSGNFGEPFGPVQPVAGVRVAS